MPALHRSLCLLAPLLAVLPMSPTALAAPLEVTVQDAVGQPVENAVVTVTVAGAPKTAPAGASAQVAQQNRQFVPQVTVVQVGTAVNFPNLDTVRHHVYSFSPAKTFELKLYAGTPSTPVVFDKAGTAVLGCNIHDRMAAWIAIVDTPYFARTDATGHARLDIPEGEHRLRAWQPMAEGAAPVERPVRAGAPGVVLRLAKAPGA